MDIARFWVNNKASSLLVYKACLNYTVGSSPNEIFIWAMNFISRPISCSDLNPKRTDGPILDHTNLMQHKLCSTVLLIDKRNYFILKFKNCTNWQLVIAFDQVSLD